MAAPPASMAPPLLPPTNDRATHHRTHRRRLGWVCAHLQGRRPAASPLPATATAAAVTSPARSSSGQRPVASQLATAQPPWPAIDVEFAQAAAIGQHSGAANPLARLSRGDVPAVILRQAMPPRECAGLIRRFAERGLLPEPFVPFISPELGLSEALARHAGDGAPGTGGSRWVGLEETGQDPSAALAERLDIGTALGNLGGDQPSFFEDAARSRTLYSTLFDGLPTHPVELMYGALSKLSGGRKQVLTAREPDGREYCPTIYRSHMPEYGYAPHIDSVRHRERRTDYEVFRFGSQLGGILLLHAPVRRPLDGEGRTPGYTPPSDQYHDTIMYDAPCTREDVVGLLASDDNNIPGGMLKTSAFRDFAADAQLRSCPVDLEVGDMYFFKSDSLHEVPGFTGDLARVVQATFIGYSEDDPEIMVWS